MKYIDTSVRQADQTIAWWMQQVAASGLCEFRCQSGYFTLEGSGPLLLSLEDWANRGSMLRLLLGSNRAATLASHISYLAGRLGMPRAHVTLGIVSYDGSLFHPKVYHFVREDKSETAYVGSANFTGPGISGLNVEAGIIIDTREGDDPAILEGIRARIDAWFDGAEEGLSLVSSPGDIDRLLNDGYLSLRAIRPPAEAGLPGQEEEGTPGPPRPRRTAAVKLPKLDDVEETATAEILAGDVTAPLATTMESAVQEAGPVERVLRYTEASFHYPQGTHLGHILAILWRFSTGRQGTPFDDEFIRLNGSLGTGRIAGYRRQIKYKLLAAIEMGLVNDIRYAESAAQYSPVLTDQGSALWELAAPYVDIGILEMGGGDPSTTLPKLPAYYNQVIREACAASPPLMGLYSGIMLGMPAVAQMLEFLGQFPEDRVAKNDIYEGFFSFGPVVEFCNQVGIEPQTDESARHRCPFLLNILESLGRLDQERAHIIRR